MARWRALVHGNAFTPERFGFQGGEGASVLEPFEGLPGSEFAGRPGGKGRGFRGRHPYELWFHAAVPLLAPAEAGLRAIGLFVRFRATLSARLTAVRLFDGETRLFAIDGLALGGDHSQDLAEGTNAFKLPAGGPEVTSGLDLACRVSFKGNPWSEVTFVAAGVELEG
jgi:hypothetical protein